MSHCPICQDTVKAFGSPNRAHIVIHKDTEDHIHVHGDLDRKHDIKEMLDVASEEVGVAITKSNKELPKEIVFHNKQRIGDMLVFTSAIRDFKAAFPHVRVNVSATAPHIWDHNPNIDRSLVPTPENTIKIGPSWLTNKSNSLDWHFTNAYRISIEQALDIHIPQGESRPDIYLTEEEYNAPRVIENPYWIICVNGEKGWGCKMYPFVKWQEFVSKNREITFVQIGTREDNPPRLQGPNVIDYVGRTQSKDTGIRDLYKLFLNAEGSIGLVSFHMHLSGALHKPCIVVAGAREPVHFTRYPGHAYLATDGMLPCATKACWHCGIETCTNPVNRPDQNGKMEIVPKCVDMITPDDLTNALNNYYIGGRLHIYTPSEKPKFKNIVKTPPKPIVVTEQKGDKMSTVEGDKMSPPETYGLSFGGGSLLETDWSFISNLIKDNKIKTVLEFGCGLSTLLFQAEGVELTSYETMPHWINRIRNINPVCDIRLWDGVDPGNGLDNHYDLAFVDGPSGGHKREHAVRIASERASIVIVHDGHGEFEKEWQNRHLIGKFDGPVKNKGRCWMWAKKGRDPVIVGLEVNKKPIVEIDRAKPLPDKASGGALQTQRTRNTNVVQKSIKIVTTARGWGGQARSITTIMDLLLKGGHRVEFIPFRNAVTSSEMKVWLGNHPQIKVTEHYDTLKEKCDVLFMYADDYIWEFKDPIVQAAFAEIGAERKIMMLNYRRGSVGETEWTKGWNKYMFLNSGQEKELLKYIPKAYTKVLPPCTDLTPFFKVNPDYNHNLRIVRHSSQGDTKFSKDFLVEVENVLSSREDVELSFLPGPSFVQPSDRIKKQGRTADPEVIAKFLSKGNLFWYSLPNGYSDMGPRVILEAMAAGLPILADNWGGAKDRVARETGWLCDNKGQHIKIIQGLTVAELEKKGKAAREKAFTEFVPERWVEEILC